MFRSFAYTSCQFASHVQERTMSPLLWTDDDIRRLLKGTSVVDEALQRKVVLRNAWDDLAEILGQDPDLFPPGNFILSDTCSTNDLGSDT